MRLPKCQTCKGRGEIEIQDTGHFPWTCSDCGGTGVADPFQTIREAIENEGPRPALHRKIMKRHRKEWPTLWKAIDAALKEDTPQ